MEAPRVDANVHFSSDVLAEPCSEGASHTDVNVEEVVGEDALEERGESRRRRRDVHALTTRQRPDESDGNDTLSSSVIPDNDACIDAGCGDVDCVSKLFSMFVEWTQIGQSDRGRLTIAYVFTRLQDFANLKTRLSKVLSPQQLTNDRFCQ